MPDVAMSPAIAEKHRATACAKVIVLAGICFSAAIFSLELSHGPFGFAPIWPANAILFAAVLRCKVIPWRYLAAGGVASFTANWFEGGSWLTCAGFSVANVAESLLARHLLRATAVPGWLSDISGRALTRLWIAAGAGAGVSAAIATVFAYGNHSIFFASWFLADFLGMLIVTPITILVADAIAGRTWRDLLKVPLLRMAEAVLLIAAVTLVTLVTFLQDVYSLLFLPTAVMMAAVVRIGTVGASLGILVIAAIATIATGLGSGPVLMAEGGRIGQAFFLQAYLLVIYTAALPTAALLGTQRRLVKELRENNRLLNLAEAAAHLGHWRVRLHDRHIYWSDETFRVYGLPIGAPPPISEAIDAYIEEDRDLVGGMFEAAVRHGKPYEFRARIRRHGDGAIRDILSRGDVDLAPDGTIIAVFGMIQDVTAQSDQERALDRARLVAEEAAACAQLASETDALTGLPNRRQLLIILDRARAQAIETRQPLSVAILDIDHFKRVNDTFGHVIGDRVLQRVARNSVSALRSSDSIGRFGGEEFVIVLPNATPDIAEAIANRVRAAIEAESSDSFGEWPVVTASVGVAGWRRGEPLTALLQRADEALYEAKRSGRNKVCCAADGIDLELGAQ